MTTRAAKRRVAVEPPAAAAAAAQPPQKRVRLDGAQDVYVLVSPDRPASYPFSFDLSDTFARIPIAHDLLPCLNVEISVDEDKTQMEFSHRVDHMTGVRSLLVDYRIESHDDEKVLCGGRWELPAEYNVVQFITFSKYQEWMASRDRPIPEEETRFDEVTNSYSCYNYVITSMTIETSINYFNLGMLLLCRSSEDVGRGIVRSIIELSKQVEETAGARCPV